MATTYFSGTFMNFFKNLAQNNNTSWFNENKKTYEAVVKKPFVDFIEHLIQEVKKSDDRIQITAADAILRINKDIRFSKDKSPYKLYTSAIISPAGKRDKGYPGMYLEVSPEDVKIYGGAYELDNEKLLKIRNAILHNPTTFKKAYQDKKFVEAFGEVLGDKNKKLLPEHKSFESKEPLIANKQFYFMASLPAKQATLPGFDKVVLGYFKAAKKINDFFIDAINE